MLNLNKQRDLKITGATVSVSQNGKSVNAPVLDRQTLYASALITITDKGYTKHYFEEGNRICSSIGSGGFSNIFQHTSPIVSDLKEINSKTNQNAINTYKNNIGVTPYINVTSIYPYIFYHRSTLYKSAPEAVFYYHTDHLGSATLITDDYAQIAEQIVYMPYGEDWIDVRSNGYFGSAYKFNGKEKDDETGYSYYGARYYTDRLSIWLSVDPLADKYPHLSPYAYCADNPVMLVDPDGRDWEDADGNKITDHSKIKAYIFYDPRGEGEGFAKQSKAMYNQLEAKYGKGSVAMSNVTTEKEFIQDWGDMASSDIKEVNLNYHGNNQTIILNKSGGEYITSTGNGETNKSGTSATNVQDLPIPSGNISNAQLNLNTCKSNSRTQYELKGSKETLMEAFFKSTNFKIVRGTSSGVSYDRRTLQPFPGHSWSRGSWVYIKRRTPVPEMYPGVGLPPK